MSAFIGYLLAGVAMFIGFFVTALAAARVFRSPNEMNNKILEHYRIAEERLAESARHHDRIASVLENALLDAHAELAVMKERAAVAKGIGKSPSA